MPVFYFLAAAFLAGAAFLTGAAFFVGVAFFTGALAAFLAAGAFTAFFAGLLGAAPTFLGAALALGAAFALGAAALATLGAGAFLGAAAFLTAAFLAAGAFLTTAAGAAFTGPPTLTAGFATIFFAFFSSAPSLKEALILMNLPVSAPLLRAARRRCWANLMVGWLATMWALIACGEDPVLSFRAAIASLASSK